MKKTTGFAMAMLVLIQMLLLCATVLAVEPATISVSSAEAGVGDTVVLSVSVADNTGFGGVGLNVKFDNKVLEFVGAECNLVGGMAKFTPASKANAEGSVDLVYAGIENIFTNGELFTVTFTVKEGADLGDSDLTLVLINFDDASFVYDENYNMNDFTASVISGKITVTKKSAGLCGDVNLDGKVDSDDLTALARHVGGIEEFTDSVSLSNGDVNFDGKVDSDDLTALARHVGGIEEFPEAG